MKYPATHIIHTVQGPEPCCAKHAVMLRNLMQFMGSGVNATVAPEGSECNNCRNEAAEEGAKP
jgi:hypothetical protein